MKVYLSLVRLYLASFYNLPGKKAPGKPAKAVNPDTDSAKGRSGARIDGKRILKTAGIAALVLLVVGNLGVVFITMNLGLYDSLAPIGMQGMLLLNAAFSATMITLLVGFLMALSTYFLSEMELQFLAMPIPAKALLGAKFTAVYVSEAVFSLFFMGTAMVIFGIKENPGFLFYLWGTLAAVLLPLPALAAAYLVQIPLMGLVRFMKNKQSIMIIGGVIGMAFAIGFNMYYQGMMPRLGDAAWVAEHFAGPSSLVARFGSAYPPSLLAWRAMDNPASAGAAWDILMLAAICVAGPLLVIMSLAGPYVKSLVGFNESQVRKLDKKDAESFLLARLRQGSPFVAMVRREVSTMNREPMYLLNGPFIIIIMPLMLVMILAVQKDSLMSNPALAELRSMMMNGTGVVIASLAGTFLGSSTSISCTALSRDAKALPYIKSLPIPAGRYMLAKLAHGLLFAVFGALVGTGLPGLAVGLSVPDAALALGVALSLSFLFNLGGLWLDTANPRMNWDNPIAAMKQNPNAVIAILGCMGLAGGIGYLAISHSLGRLAFGLLFGLAPAVLFAVLLALYPRYAEKRLADLEA